MILNRGTHAQRLVSSLLLTCSVFFGNALFATESNSSLKFIETPKGEFHFNTGILAGKLRNKDQSIGLLPVTYMPTKQDIAGGAGLFNHYRVFTKGKRYGYGARRWPSEANLQKDGSVEIIWPVTQERPFELRAHYRWIKADTLDLTTTVTAKVPLTSFEVFLASYQQPEFTQSLVHAANKSKQSVFVSAEKELGEWQVFPRNKKSLKTINDGRWNLEPHPLQWTIQQNYGLPVAVRQDPNSGLSVTAISKREDCFGIFTPYGTEKHYSHYMSLFGKHLQKGERATARSRLIVQLNPSEKDIVKEAEQFLKDQD